jgi:uncharacterized membrane protein YhaH (DUF805 family)
MASSKFRKFQSYEGDDSAKERRSQYVILLLSVLLLFFILNSAFQYVDLSISDVQPMLVIIAILVGLLALASIGILAMPRRGAKKKK